jgi:serpin B
MKKHIAILFAICGLALASCGGGNTQAQVARPHVPAEPPTSTQLAAFAEPTNAFAFDLWSRLPRDGNQIVSPASIEIALAMTYGGAGGETAAEMSRALHLSGDSDATHEAFSRVLATWNDPNREDYELAVANRIYLERTFPLRESFVALTRDSYRAPLEKVDFVNEPDPSRVLINQWVAGQTHDRIRDLIPSGGVTGDTRLVLVNAIYFLGKWATEFDANATQNAPFHSPGHDVQARMMHQTANFAYGEVDGVQLLQMPYRGGEMAMLVALPRDAAGLNAMQGSLDASRLNTWVASLHEEEVEVSFPRARIAPADPLALSDQLQAMGMRQAFTDQADFSGMQEGVQTLYVSQVFHKAFVEIDEEGTEAAAATAVVINEESARLTQSFNADHPFLFFLRDTRSGAILFMGRLVDPTAG